MKSSHVKISMISLISSLSPKFVGVSSKHLRFFLESLRESSKMFGNVHLAFGAILELIFRNLRKVVGNLKIVKNFRHHRTVISKFI